MTSSSPRARDRTGDLSGRARPVSVARGVVTTAQGSALAKVGRTTAVAAVKLEPVAPALDAPDLGVLEVTVELPPMCSASTRPGRPSRGGAATRRIADALADARVVDLTKLCIKEASGRGRFPSTCTASTTTAASSTSDSSPPSPHSETASCPSRPWTTAEDPHGRRGASENEPTRDRPGPPPPPPPTTTTTTTSPPRRRPRGAGDGARVPVALTVGLYKANSSSTRPRRTDVDGVDRPVVVDDGRAPRRRRQTGGTAEATETTLAHCVAAARLRYPPCAKAMEDAFGGER